MNVTTAQGVPFAEIAVGALLPTVNHRLSTLDIAVGAAGSRDWLPQHYDHRVAIEENGLADVLINTPAIASWFERLITDWTGPSGRIGRMRLGLRKSILAREEIELTGEVLADRTDETGCRWLTITAAMRVGDEKRVESEILVAVPTSADDSPWLRRGPRWAPA